MNVPSPLPHRLRRYFDEYGAYHQRRGNVLCHELAIPMIEVAVLGLLARLPVLDFWVGLDAGLLFLGFVLTWFVLLDWKLTIPFGLSSLGLYSLGRAAPPALLWVLFVLGWAIQFIGHFRYEKKSPTFLTNLKHLLIGPLWLFAKIVGYSFDSPNTKLTGP